MGYSTTTHMMDEDIEQIAEILVRFGGGDFDARAARREDGSAVDKLAFAVNLTLEELAARKRETDRQLEALDDRAAELVIRQRELEAANLGLHKARERLQHMGKLGALGELSAMLAHELTQPLTAIAMNAAVLLESQDGPFSDELRQVVRDTVACTERVSEVVRNLTQFARDDSLSMRLIRPREPLDAALLLFKQQFFRHAIACVVRAPAGLPHVFIDRSFTQQVFINLLANARDALVLMPPPAPRRVEIELQDRGDAVHYLIRNNGPEIPEELRPRIFEAFFTTKPSDIGTGLGLALSRDIVDRQGGALELAPGAATCFVVRLPTAP